MPVESRIVAGHHARITTRKADGAIVRVDVPVGDDKPGWRVKDVGSRVKRREVKEAVAAGLGIAPKLVRLHAVYNSLSVTPDGMIQRRDDAGRVIGIMSQGGGEQ